MKTIAILVGAAALGCFSLRTATAAPHAARASSVSPLAREATDLGPLPPDEIHRIVVGLELRDPAGLEALLEEVQDPASPSYRQFHTQDQFNARFAPAPQDEQAVVSHLEASGLAVTDRFPNRLLVGASGSVWAIERAFGVRLHAVQLRGRRHFATQEEPVLPSALARVITGVTGLDDLGRMRPRSRPSGPVAAPSASIGSNCCHLSPNDLRSFYDDTTELDGAGVTLVIAGAYAWKDSDNTAFSNQWSLPQLPAGSGQVCTGSGNPQGCRFSNQNSLEIALDVEYSHGTAPGAIILNYMAASTLFTDFAVMYNRIVSDNPGHVVSTSWGACEAGVSTATQLTNDSIFANANAIGQSWFAASGDNGSRDCSGLLTVDHPANSPHIIGVGGTTPACSGGMTPSNPACAGYGNETGWSGSGGGVSALFARPPFQMGCGVPAGSTRVVPDVALEANGSPGNYVIKNGLWYIVGGTSGAAPQWAGFAAKLSQQQGGAGLGNPGAYLYSLCDTPRYHDIISGSNGDYAAAAGYDLVTGLGSIHAANFFAQLVSVPALSRAGAALLLGLLVGAGVASAAGRS